MKKFVATMASLLAVVLLAVGFAGCSKASAVKKAYEKEGYTVSTSTVKDNETAKSALKTAGMTDEEIKDAEEWELITATKTVLLDYAIVIKFPSKSDLKEFLTDDNGDSSAYDTAKDDDTVKGDCYLLVSAGGATSIFKNL